MVLYLKFIVILIIILLSTQPLNAETILSKGDAIEMFGMSKEQWKKNLLLGKSAGLMDFNITQDGNYKMLLRTIGLLTVTPVYEGGDNMPIQLIVESIFDEEPYSTTEQTRAEFEIDLIFVEAMQDMRPEFSVVGHMNRIESGPVTYFFTIVRKGAFPEIDLLNEKERACFLNCLNPVNQRASKPLESIKPEFVEYTKYENKKHGFEFKYPKTWEMTQNPYGESKVLVKNCFLCGHQETFNVAVDAYKEVWGEDERSEQLIEKFMKSLFPDAKVTDSGTIEVGGIQGVYVSIHYTLKQTPRVLRQIILDKGGLSYVLTLGSHPAHQDNIRSVFEKILGSFKITNSEKEEPAEAEVSQHKAPINLELKQLIYIQLPRLDPASILNNGSIIAITYSHLNKPKEYKNKPDITVIYKGKTANPSKLPCHKIYQPDETFNALGYGMSWDLKTEICHWDGEKVYISDVIPMMVKFGEYAKSTSGDIQVREDVIAEELMKHHKIEDLRSVAGVGQ